MALQTDGDLFVERTLPEAFALCVRAVEAIPRAQLIDALESRLLVEIKVPLTIQSWGERIELTLRDEGDGVTLIHIDSRSRFRQILFDYGKNAENVRALSEWLARAAAT